MTPARSLSRRIAPSVAGLVAFAIVVALLLSGAHSTYNHLLTLWGFEPFQYPFLDLENPFAAWECSRKGVDVIISDPCDVLRRGYIYSPLWMTFDWIPLNGPDSLWAGVVLSIAFLISFSALPPALSAFENGLRIAAALSTMTAFAVERQNPDVLIFLIVIGALPLLNGSTVAKTLGYGLIFLGGAIKYYPFALLTLIARERFRLGISIFVASFIGLAVFWSVYASQILEGLPYIPTGSVFGNVFGIKNLPLGLLIIFHEFTTPLLDAVRYTVSVVILLGGVLLWAMLKLSKISDIPASLRRVDEARRLALLAGALLLAGCFSLGQNVAYRGIFLFFIIPGLSALARDRDAGALASASRLAMIGVPILMWAEGIRLWIHLAVAGAYPSAGFSTLPALEQPLDFVAWLAREVGWWLLIGFLLTILFSDLVVLLWRNRYRLLLRPKT